MSNAGTLILRTVGEVRELDFRPRKGNDHGRAWN